LSHPSTLSYNDPRAGAGIKPGDWVTTHRGDRAAVLSCRGGLLWVRYPDTRGTAQFEASTVRLEQAGGLARELLFELGLDDLLA